MELVLLVKGCGKNRISAARVYICSWEWKYGAGAAMSVFRRSGGESVG